MSSRTSPTPVQTPNKALQVYEISSTQTLGRVCWVFLNIIDFVGKTKVLTGEGIQSSSTKFTQQIAECICAHASLKCRRRICALHAALHVDTSAWEKAESI